MPLSLLSCCKPHRSRPKKKSDHTRKMSLFGSSNHDPNSAVQKMVDFTTLVSPTKPFHHNHLGDMHLSHDVRRVLDRLFDDLRGEQVTLSRAKFDQFLRQTQRESPLALDKDGYTFGDFLWTWFHNFSWDAVAPLAAKDATKPLTNYFISSSHNTYLEGNQFLSRSTPQAYVNVLSKGGRCIEIDVWSGEATTPPRCNSKSPAIQYWRQASANSLSNALDEVCDTARRYLSSPARCRSDSHNSATLGEESTRSSGYASPAMTDNNDVLDPLQATLSRGCSAIPKGEPVVRHGPTMTPKCGFREVAEAIRDSAFVDNDLPIIISLEMHADLDQQEVMVRIMKEVWQDMLIQAPSEGRDPRFRVPTLDELRGKILIKVKRPQATIWSAEKLGCAATPQANVGRDEDFVQDAAKWRNCTSAAAPLAVVALPESSSKVPIHEKLSELAVYTRSAAFGGFDTPQAKRPTHIFSISESGIIDLDEKQHEAMFVHNKHFFMRSYPNATRINSSNHDPTQFWRKGVQMVAMNWQYPDKGMMLNYGMFADEQGWVLKPPGYRSSDKDSKTQYDAAETRTMDLGLTIFKSQKLPVNGDDEDQMEIARKSLHSVIRVEIHTERSSGALGQGKIAESVYVKKMKARKSDAPLFGARGETLEFRGIPNVVEELSFLLIKIDDEYVTGLVNWPTLAWTCIRLDRLRSGYRFINLLDIKGIAIPGGRLFVKIVKEFR